METETKMASPMVPLATEQPTMPLLDAGAVFGLKRTATYDAYHSGTFPVTVLKVGGKLMCPTAEVRVVLGFDPPLRLAS